MNKNTSILLAVACFVAAMCSFTSICMAAEQQQTPGSTVAVSADYTIEEEDVLRLDVWGEQSLSGMQMQVTTPGGKVNVPYIGELKAAGLTLTQLTDEIVKRFEEADILRSPKIQLTLITMHQPMVYVLGQVQRPGSFPFKPNDTIMDAIAMAGSYTPDAMLEKATVTHKDSSDPIPLDLKVLLLDGNLAQNAKLQKGDTIFIPSEDYQNKIYVMGQVLRPGMFAFKPKTTILSAVNLAGGPAERASMRSTTIIRGGPDKPQRVACNLAKLFDKADLTQDVALQPGDVVYVPETKKPDLNKISQVLNVLFNLSYIRRVGLF